MPWTRNNVTVDTVANTAGISACAFDTFAPTTLTFDLSASQNAACWPWTSQVVAMVRTRYTSTATDSSSCARGLDALQFLQWLYTNQQLTTLTSNRNVQSATALSSTIQAAYLAALDSVTCDGTTLLITLPTVWSLTSAIAAFVQALSVIGLVGSAVAAVLAWRHHAHPVIRSASPLFLLLSIGGVAMLFAAGFLLVSQATAASCSAFSWLLNFGLQLCFAPLFAKTYRIYRIFGRKKLSVVQLSNRKLMLIVLAILAVEAVLMAVWQGVGPIAPLTINVTSTALNSAGHNIINQYTQCGVPAGSSMSMFAVICVEKGMLFVFGALMAFTTRKVSSTFNESQGISLSIYNVCFTIGIISPIITRHQCCRRRPHPVAEVFALLWIAYFTGGILFVPKLSTIYFHTNGSDQLNPSVVGSSSSSSGFQFLSLAALSTLPMLQGYQAALRKHLEAVDARVAKLRTTKGSVAAPSHHRSTVSGVSARQAPLSFAAAAAAVGVVGVVSPNGASANSFSSGGEESIVRPATGSVVKDTPPLKPQLVAAAGSSWTTQPQRQNSMLPGARVASAGVDTKDDGQSAAEEEQA